MNKESCLSIVIPTYRRERVLIDTVSFLLRLSPGPSEVLIVDQTKEHSSETLSELAEWQKTGQIRWIRLTFPSIPHAMNIGLKEAKHDIVLFLDDDILPDKNLVAAHINAHNAGSYNIVAGQVLQPGEEPLSINGSGIFRFCSNGPRLINEFIGCNFSVKKRRALALGGFDKNFVHVAYRYEAEFADRAISAGEKILFEPAASIRHLKAERGGTRSYGVHLRSIKPSHSVGEYYYLMRAGCVRNRLFKMISRPLRAIRTRHHLRNPWWIPIMLIAELWGFLWALLLFLRGPRLIGWEKNK